MQDKLRQIVSEVGSELEKISDSKELEALKVKVLGKKGQLTELMRGMGALSKEERPVVGKMVNDARAELENMIGEFESKLAAREREARLTSEVLDVTIPGNVPQMGHLHPLTHVIRRVEEITMRLPKCFQK